MPSRDLQSWEFELNEAIAEEIALVCDREYGVKNIKEPMRGLVDIFGASPEVQERGRLRLVASLNKEPLNLAARKWLPPDWRNNNSLHVLGLMLWGVSEANTVPEYWETEDLAGGLIAAMMGWNPAYVMALLQNPERPESAGEEVFISAEDIEGQESAEDAAWVLMESLEIFVRSQDML